MKESQQLEESKEQLNRKIQESEEALKHLEEDKAELERDIKVKKITLNIDKNKCFQNCAQPLFLTTVLRNVFMNNVFKCMFTMIF